MSIATASRTGRRRSDPFVDALQFYYRGDGCEVSPSCLRCPLPQCKYDDLQAYKRVKREAQYAPAKQLLAQGVGTREVARMLGFSERTAARLKAGARGIDE